MSSFLKLASRPFYHQVNGTLASKHLFSSLFFLHITLITAYYISDSFTGRGFDESVIYIFYSGIEGLEASGYAYLLISTLFFLLLALYLSIRIPNRWQFLRNLKNTRKSCLNSALIIFLTVQPVSINLFLNSAFYNSFTDLHNPDISLALLNNVTIENRPNLIYIYLEGFERSFLDDSTFPGLAPNLRRLESQALSFNNIKEVYGTRWTIAGMVASQCGLPLQPVANANKPGTFMPGAYCLGDILHENDYYLAYLGGASMRFGGKGNFYTTHKFDLVEGRSELLTRLPESTPVSEWGLYDEKLFSLVADKHLQLSQLEGPFGLFLLTLDTHPPEGYPSSSCSGIQYRDGSNPTLNAVHCSDLLVSQLVKKIMSVKSFDNTLIVVASDHLSLNSTASNRLEQVRRRNLFFVLGDNISPGVSDRYGSPLDITPTLLSLMGTSIAEFNLGVDLLGKQPTLVEKSIDPDRDLRTWSKRLQDFY